VARKKNKNAALELLPVEGAGNRFLLLNGFAGPVPDNPGGLAMVMCRAGGGSAFKPDGLLLLQRPSKDAPGAIVRMVLYNADGTRPEACGNGLRCVARVAVDRGYAAAGEFRVETDSGQRRVRVEAKKAPVVTVEIGQAELGAQWEELEVGDERVRGRRVDMGNPHFVLEARAWNDADVARLGPALTAHAAFEAGANIGFPSLAEDGAIELRVHERGVGETRACGTGACAAAAVHGPESGACQVPVRLPGGQLLVERDEAGVYWLNGPVSCGAK
jgi:diaminopimelate epimerase